ncbi:DUF4214 domain-containing protein [Massilia sp. Root335]|uniref:DUF4214 domain-containing protein n=1 Tax=Massilia sp. Root335 TaxID=1736517 RepID=UPI000A79BF2C|nr:DUF4214 domain-containing protein [Massilia sp. Root335]
MTTSDSETGFLASIKPLTEMTEAVEKLGKAFEALSKLFDAQRSFDTLRTQLKVVTGSVGDAALAFKGLQALAAVTPFNVEETTKAFVKLKTAGLDPSEKALRAYGNTATGLGESLDKVVDAVADAAKGNFEELEKLGISAEKNGGRVSLTFQGATATIGNNAKEIEAYLQTLGQTKFGDAMAIQSATLDGAIGNLKDAWNAFTLSLSQAGLGEVARDGIEAVTGALKAFSEQADAIVSGLKIAAEIGAAYFAVFVAGPAIVAAVTTAFAALEQEVLLVRLAMAIGASTTDLLTNSFGGMSVSARLAEGSLTKVRLAGSVMMAAFAGWEIGSWLYDNFVEARLAGLAFVEVMLTGWEHLKYGAEMAWEYISSAWNNRIAEMRTALAGFLAGAGKGFSLLGATDTASSLDTYAAKLRAAAAEQKSFTERTQDIKKAHQEAVAAIHKSFDELAQGEIAASQAAEKAKKKVTSDHLGNSAAKTSTRSNVDVERDDEAKRTAELLGVNGDYIQQLSLLEKMRTTRNLSDAEYVKLVEELIGKQPAAKKAMEESAQAKEAENKATTDAGAAAKRDIDAIDAQTQALNTKIKSYGMVPAAITDMQIAELEASRQSSTLSDLERDAIQRKIDALKSLHEAQDKLAGKDAAAESTKQAGEAAKKAEEEWKHTAESIQKSLTDAMMRGFESGKSMAKELGAALKKIFDELVVQRAINAAMTPISQGMTSLLGGGAAADGAGSAASSGIGSGISSLVGASGIASSFGSYLATGFMNSIAGTGMSAGLSAAGAMIANGAWAQGIGMAAGALGPIALGAAAVYMLAKSIDHSGTPHTGGAASSSGGTTSIIQAESLHFEKTAISTDTEKFVSSVAASVASMLDSTATAFGGKAGYAVATAFADDSSKDGAWGGLSVSKGGQKILDWQDTRTSRWAPKEFADGEAGQKQYLADISKSVRYALDQIGLPGWAGKMLDALGDAPSLDDMGKTVDMINKTESALKVMGEHLVGFGAMSDEAVSALMTAAGGIDALANSAGAYYDAFYSDGEKSALMSQQVADVLQKVGLAMPASRDEFRAMVEAQLKLGAAGAPAAAALFGVANAFAQIHPATESATDSIASARAALTTAYQTESDAIKATTDRMSNFAASLRKLHDGALLGNLSTLTPQQKYLEAKAQYEKTLSGARAGDADAQGQYQDAYNAFLSASQAVNASGAQYQRDFAYAQAATEDAIKWAEQQVDVGKASLDALNRQVAGLVDVKKEVTSVGQAIRDLASVMGPAGTGTVAASQDSAITALYQSMLHRAPDAAGLKFWEQAMAAGSSIADIAQAIGRSAEYQDASAGHGTMSGNRADVQVRDTAAYLAPAAPLDYGALGTSNMNALVGEIKALRTDNQSLRDEVRGLRGDAERQTGDLMAANAAVSDNSAGKIVEATARAALVAAQTRETRVMPT